MPLVAAVMPPLSRFPLRWMLLLVLGLFAVSEAQAQVGVTLQIKRRMFVLHEPILATVTIANNSGRELMLSDTEDGGQWFRITITNSEGVTMPPRNASYELPPLALKAGETMKRTVNLLQLFPLGECGNYRVKTSIYVSDTRKYYVTKLDFFDVIEGRVINRKSVGVPDGAEGSGGTRKFTLLTLEQDRGKELYLRIEGEEDAVIYGCYNLGRMIEGFPPDIKFDTGNNAAVLQLVAPKTFLLSRIGVNGSFLGQSTYVTPKSQPFLRKLADGNLQIVGAVRQKEVAVTAPQDLPKVSDRPPGF